MTCRGHGHQTTTFSGSHADRADKSESRKGRDIYKDPYQQTNKHRTSHRRHRPGAAVSPRVHQPKQDE
ncbi:hypothetical protein C8Q77DRAFT_1130459 [Trametes polyzona]|nr:hypothetical protein C8Q77DRAFT_1130459 [Trametes polyzona]